MSAYQAEGKHASANLKEEEKFQRQLAPHERIPTEILAEVFLTAAGNEVVVFPPDFSRTPWVLSRVCHRWRNVALGEWRLWNEIKFLYTYNDNAPRLIALANRILPFGTQLSIEDDKAFTLLDQLVMDQLVIPRLPRIKVFRSSLGPRAYKTFFAVSPETLASIEELDLPWSSLDPLDNSSIKDIAIFSKAHKLQKLRITPSFPDVPEPNMAIENLLGMLIPWHQLIVVCLECTSYTLSAEQMRLFSADVVDFEAAEGDIVLPHLHTLSLQVWGFALMRLILPALKKLRLRAKPFESTDTQISHMLSRSQCQLDEFKLIGFRPWICDVSLTSELLSHMSTVRVFMVDLFWLERPVLDMIGRGELLPRVSRFRCGVHSIEDFVDALERRLGEKGEEEGSMVTRLEVADGLHMLSELRRAEGLLRLDALNRQYGTRYSLLCINGLPNLISTPWDLN